MIIRWRLQLFFCNLCKRLNCLGGSDEPRRSHLKITFSCLSLISPLGSQWIHKDTPSGWKVCHSMTPVDQIDGAIDPPQLCASLWSLKRPSQVLSRLVRPTAPGSIPQLYQLQGSSMLPVPLNPRNSVVWGQLYGKPLIVTSLWLQLSQAPQPASSKSHLEFHHPGAASQRALLLVSCSFFGRANVNEMIKTLWKLVKMLILILLQKPRKSF